MISKAKKIKRISLFLAILLPTILIGIVLAIILLSKTKDETPILDTNNDQYRIQEISEFKFLSDQKNNVSFLIEFSTAYNENDSYFSIVDSSGVLIENSLISSSENIYEILPPDGGYKPGGIYYLELVDQVSFVDKRFKDNFITFSIEKPEILKYDLKDNIEVSKITALGKLENNLLIFDEIIPESLFSFNSIGLYSILSNGFPSEAFFNIQSISYENGKTICSGIIPKLTDVFDNLEVYKHIDLEEQNFIFLSEQEIAQSILDSDFIEDTINVIVKYQNEINPSEIARKYNSVSINKDIIDQYADDMKNELNFDIDFDFQPNLINIYIGVSIENFIRIGNPVSAVINFYIDFDVTITFDSLVDIDIWAGEFAFGIDFNTTIGVKARVEVKGEFPLDDQEKKIEKTVPLVESFKNFIKSNSK